MEEKTLDLKQSGQQPDAGNGQPGDAKTPVADDFESEIEETVLRDVDSELTESDDETVVLSKREVEKLRKERENYRKGLLSLKDKMKGKKTVENAKTVEGKPSEYMTRSEFEKINERRAIQEVCEDEDIDSNWGDIVKYYVPRRGKTSVENIKKDIEDAHTLYRKENPSGDKVDKKTGISDISAENGMKKTTTDQGKKSERKSILAKKTPVQDWY